MNALTILFSPKPFVGLDAVNQRNALASWRREQMEGVILPRGLTWIGAKAPRMCPFLTAVGHDVERLAPIFMRWP